LKPIGYADLLGIQCSKRKVIFMLTEDEKKHIREEELFRREVQQQFDPEKPPASIGKRLWSLMNSGFALWFLSSIVVGYSAGCIQIIRHTI
jgi:hypothetical protein